MRQKFISNQYQLNLQLVNESKERHLQSMEFLDLLINKNNSKVQVFLNTLNTSVNPNDLFGLQSRTIILMDATGSMYYLIESCKLVIEKLFDRINTILKTKKVDAGFEIQLAVYRNYNVTNDLILEHSPWESQPDDLRTFLRKIKVGGGISEEAIEIGLNHANNEYDNLPISQVILIGDAPSNSKAQTIERRQNNYGTHYWEESKYRDVIDYKEELKLLKSKNVPVNTFYLDIWAKKNFEEIAKETNGKCHSLSVKQGSDDEKLTNVVCENILRNIGKISKIDGEELVKEYMSRYSRSYN